MNRQRMRVAIGLLTMVALLAPSGYAQQTTGQNQAQTAPANLPASASQASPDPAHQLTLSPDYSIGKPWFPHFKSPYTPVDVPQPMLTNSPGSISWSRAAS